MSAHIGNVVIDCAEPQRLGDFWQQALAYRPRISGLTSWFWKTHQLPE